MAENRQTIQELVRLYQDLEHTLKGLKAAAGKEASVKQINVRRLISRLSTSKKRLERKIGNTLLLEKHEIKVKLHKLLGRQDRARRNKLN